MIQLPQDKVFLIKFNCDVHRDLVSRMILRVGGQVATVADQKEFITKFNQYQPTEIAGVVYELGDETKCPYNLLTNEEQERILRELRSIVGVNIPIVATYYCPADSKAQDDDLIATGKRLGSYGADAVLSHPFGLDLFYSALEKALEKHK